MYTEDLISRQAAIDAILAIKDYGNSDRANALGLAECAVTTLPSVQPEHTETHACDYQRTETHDWIPVTKALPRDDEDVIVTCLDDSGDTPYSYTTVAWHYKGMWVCDNMRCLFVIAWMPLPEPMRGTE